MNFAYTEKYIPRAEVKRMAEIDRDKLANYEIDPKEKYLTGQKRYLNPKKCYEKAFQYMEIKKHLFVTLVHGDYRSPYMQSHSGHAWVELPDGIIFDGVLQRFYDKEKYTDYYDLREYDRYSFDEMFEVGLQSGGNYGPWNQQKTI